METEGQEIFFKKPWEGVRMVCGAPGVIAGKGAALSLCVAKSHRKAELEPGRMNG